MKEKKAYLMLLPALSLLILFHYVPTYGIQIAFKNFKPRSGIVGSEWADLKYFQRMFREYTFTSVMLNSLWISFLKLIFCFPAGVVFALLLNEITCTKFKKFAQTVSYIPHFLGHSRRPGNPGCQAGTGRSVMIAYLPWNKNGSDRFQALP